jgi:hypothetical protein
MNRASRLRTRFCLPRSRHSSLLIFFPHPRYWDYNSLKEEGFMRVPRLLLLSLLISLRVATAPAQSSPHNNSKSSQPAPALHQNEESSTVLFQLPEPFLVDLESPSNSTPTSVQSEQDSLVARQLESRAEHLLTLQQNEPTCYMLRTYRVVRENPQSDSTRPAGYSTCQPSTRFQVRTAVDSREITPR